MGESWRRFWQGSWWPGVAFGLLLAVVGVAMVVAGEWQRSSAEQMLALTGGAIVEVNAERTDLAGLDGRLVHVHGTLTTDRPALDRLFGVEVDTPMLTRMVEMAQWQQVTDLRGRTNYTRNWYDHPIDSSQFEQPRRHRNPPFPIQPATFPGGNPSVHGLFLGIELVRALPGAAPVEPEQFTLPANLAATFHIHDHTLITSEHPGSPQIGDLRISWKKQPLIEVSIVARVKNQVLVPSPDLLAPGFVLMVGKVSLDIMLPGKSLQLPDKTWLWRILGTLLALAGVGCLLYSRRRRMPSPRLVLGCALLPVALPAGAAWLGARWAPLLIWWVLALAAAALLWRLWRSRSNPEGA